MSDHLPDAGKMVCPNCGAAKWDDDEDSFVCGSHKDGYRDFQCRHREPLWRELTTLRAANAALVEEVSALRKDQWIPAACLHILAQHGVPVGSPELLEAKGAVEAEVADLRRTNAALVEELKAHKAVTNDPHALWANWLRGDVNLPAGIGDIRQSEEKASRYRERWLSWRKNALMQERRAEAAEERVKRLEEAGDILDTRADCHCGEFVCNSCRDASAAWEKAKATQ